MLRIQRAQPLARHWLRLTLTDGTVVEREVGALLVGPVFDAIRSSDESFRSVVAVEGTVTWPGDADLDPDVLIWGGDPGDSPTERPAARMRVKLP
jgi:hypothetical protein